MGSDDQWGSRIHRHSHALHQIIRIALVAACPVPTFAPYPHRGRAVESAHVNRVQEGTRAFLTRSVVPRWAHSDVALAVAKSMSGAGATTMKTGLLLRTLGDYLGQQRLPSQQRGLSSGFRWVRSDDESGLLQTVLAQGHLCLKAGTAQSQTAQHGICCRNRMSLELHPVLCIQDVAELEPKYTWPSASSHTSHWFSKGTLP